MSQGLNDSHTPTGEPPSIVIHNHPVPQPWFSRMFWKGALIISVVINLSLWGAMQAYQPTSPNEKLKSGQLTSSDKIAFIEVTDMITGDSVKSPIKELETAAKDKAVKAVLLSVNSPGGTVSGSDRLYHAIEEYKEKSGNPVVVHMHGLATSGAYYIAAPADHIMAETTCITGSIGVIATLFEASDLLNEKLGVTVNAITSGTMKDSGSPFKKLTDEERTEWQELIDNMYGRFVHIILKYRENAVGGEAKLREVADGRVYLAPEAEKLGLIDSLGYEEDALAKARSLAGLSENVRVVTYSRPKGLAELLEMNGNTTPANSWSSAADRLRALQSPQMFLLPGSHLFAAP